ncbi:MAG: phospho-N-acetylmuramoyl-pentapeptide-transferase [Bacilli bacterium]|jgi:phospho-N-acetylmuramoyl-pentapeptide-transferase|nr:phospho-N-acetylmuramoyl-pentapeptide-transferase [Bacilli bacterium]MCX4253961.1 phospho-N-acetylmuramoyl-pentapeptide-transferase [Bacilli bacterium]
MLILAKAAMAILLGFILAIVTGLVLIPIFRKFHIGQYVSHYIGERHLKKEGTPTMGGLIFIIPTLIALFLLYINGSIEITHSLIILIFVFVSYAILGFVDDYLKIKFHNNKGLTIVSKLLVQMLIALIFFYIFMSNGGKSDLVITSLGINIPLGWTFGLFILFLLVGTSNAVNITDGLDGLAGGLSAIAFFAFGIIAWNTGWLVGYQEIAIFSFVLAGSLLGFLVFNAHPAKVFMGDLGSLSLGAALATIAILTRHELSLALIGGIFVIETLSSLIQIIAIRKFNKKVFKRAPLHHHFEVVGLNEQDIVRYFWVAGLILAMAAITYGVWL